jgi:hypothetical protein
MKKFLIVLGAILAIMVVGIFSVRFWNGSEDNWICENGEWIKHGNPRVAAPETSCSERKIIGGDRDEHGCLGPAGYAWCPSTGKCQRMWEEYCEEYKDQFKPAKSDLIQVENPSPGQAVLSPLFVIGKARGSWFFEGSFPVVLVNWDGRIIAEGQAKAQGEWMTGDFVPFRAELSFDKNQLYSRGNLILKKDNPSGLSQNEDSLEIPITFAK